MKKKNYLPLIKRTSIALFLIFGCLFPASGQGWSSTFSVIGGPGTARNDVMHIPDYTNGKTFPVSLFTAPDSESYHFLSIEGEGSMGYAFASLTNPSGSSSPINYFPKSSVMLGLDSVIVLSDKFDPGTNAHDLFITCYTLGGFSVPNFLVWHQPVYENPDDQVLGAALALTQDGQLISLGAVQTEDSPSGLAHELLLVKSDLNGQVIWTKTFAYPGDDLGVQVIPSPDGGFWLLKNVQPDLSLPDVEIWLIKTDADGTLEWQVNLGSGDVAFDMVSTNDGGLAITGTNVDQDLFVLKTDGTGSQIWRQDYPAPDRGMTGRGIIEDLQNNLVVAGRLTFDAGGEVDPFIAKLNENGTPLWERIIGKPDREDGFNDIALTPGGNYLMGGFRNIENSAGSFHGYLAKSDTFGIIKGGAVKGNVFHDLDLDCMPTAGELNLEDWKVQVVNDTLNYYANTDAQGNYEIPVEALSGTITDYVVSVIPPNEYWGACSNDIPVSIAYLDTMLIDFAIQSLVICPFMEAQIGNSNLRPCEPADLFIDYCNTGTSLAEDATIDVTLDEFLTFESSTISPSQINGQTYTFPLGDLGINECGSFVITVNVECDTVGIGDVLCIDLQLFPDTLCTVPGQEWSGALLQLTYTCDNDSLQYNIENVGNNGMSNQLEYIIIEDAVLLMEGDFNLGPAQVEEPNPLPLNGSTYHLIAQQEPGAPGPQWISLGTMGCNNGNAPDLNQFPQLSGDPFSITYCPVVVGPYDPNDKQATPSGFEEDHYILPDTDLNYTIQFQNTGTDTAFRVVITDQLSPLLNPASVQPGPSSHPYDFRLGDQGLLTFTFSNIELPDSNTNLAASQGFVTFKIAQRPTLPYGSLIENNANIFFDFNPPILTNTTFHTIGNLVDVLSSSVSVANPQTEIKVMPNPMQDGAWIQLEGITSEESILLQLFDTNGRKVQQVKGDGNNIYLSRSGLPSGMYFFTILKGGVWQASGKLIMN